MARVELVITGTRELMDALDPSRFDAALRKNIRKANTLNGKLLEAGIRSTIQRTVPPKNAALTMAIKGSDKPLVDSATLFQSVTSKVLNDFEVFGGTLRKNRKAFNVARIVHDGAVVPVTPKMRGLFFYLWKASNDAREADRLTGRAADLFSRFQGWLPLNDSTEQIIIPARKYINKTMDDKGLRRQFIANWTQALQLTFKEAAR